MLQYIDNHEFYFALINIGLEKTSMEIKIEHASELEVLKPIDDSKISIQLKNDNLRVEIM